MQRDNLCFKVENTSLSGKVSIQTTINGKLQVVIKELCFGYQYESLLLNFHVVGLSVSNAKKIFH